MRRRKHFYLRWKKFLLNKIGRIQILHFYWQDEYILQNRDLDNIKNLIKNIFSTLPRRLDLLCDLCYFLTGQSKIFLPCSGSDKCVKMAKKSLGLFTGVHPVYVAMFVSDFFLILASISCCTIKRPIFT